MHDSLKKITYTIHGTHCASCEVLIERKLREIDGIKKVDVNHATGRTVVHCECEPDLTKMQAAIAHDGYTIEAGDASPQPSDRNTSRDYLHIGAIFLIVVAIYLIARQFDLIPDIGVSDKMGYGFVFAIGLVAATSTCLAVTGGLLLGMSAKYAERHPGLSGAQKFKPTLAFNAGRIVGYTAFGAAIGGIGSAISLSSRATGLVTIVASVVMILLGLQLLKLFPKLQRFHPRMPKFLAHKIHDLSNSDQPFTPFILGAGTFFLPCGFTQALQLYVLSQGDAVKGGLIMLAFSLGTLPALLSLSIISSFAKGRFQGYFLKFAGVVVLLLGMFNIRSGFTLAAPGFDFASLFQRDEGNVAGTVDSNAVMRDGKQIVEMTVDGLDYYPYRFTVRAGIPVEWRIDGRKAAGCGRAIALPTLNTVRYLSDREITVISFTPTQPGTIPFSCPMGMTKPGSKFIVVSDAGSDSKLERAFQNL